MGPRSAMHHINRAGRHMSSASRHLEKAASSKGINERGIQKFAERKDNQLRRVIAKETKGVVKSAVNSVSRPVEKKVQQRINQTNTNIRTQANKNIDRVIMPSTR